MTSVSPTHHMSAYYLHHLKTTLCKKAIPQDVWAECSNTKFDQFEDAPTHSWQPPHPPGPSTEACCNNLSHNLCVSIFIFFCHGIKYRSLRSAFRQQEGWCFCVSRPVLCVAQCVSLLFFGVRAFWDRERVMGKDYQRGGENRPEKSQDGGIWEEKTRCSVSLAAFHRNH